jgi:uncharacterized protein (DUF2235 family)
VVRLPFALAGMLHVCGLLNRQDVHLVPFAAGLYQTSEKRIEQERARLHYPEKFQKGESTDHSSFDRQASDFKDQFGRPCAVRFMGIWDTVKAYGWLWPRSFPALRHNPSVEIVRHAVSLDERRALFKMTGWGDRHDQIKEVWFAGDHSDVGGGHPSGNSGLADASLRWMLGEATANGLRLDIAHREAVEKLEEGTKQPPDTVVPHDLSQQSNFWWFDRAPRTELNNQMYPPDRHFTMSSDGTRKPGDHHEEWPLRFHWTVAKRAERDSKYALQTLAARATRPPTQTLRIEAEVDRQIVWP